MKAVLPIVIAAVCVSSSCKPKLDMPNPPLAEQSPPAVHDVSKPQSLVGLGLDEAKKAAESAEVRWRVIEEDGISKPVTRDYDPTRLNFVLEKGIITKVSLG